MADGPPAKKSRKKLLGEQDYVSCRSSEISNVELMKLLRTAEVPSQSKIEAAFQFSQTQNAAKRVGIPMPQFLGYLADWVQSTIISSSKSQKLEGNLSLDDRAWKILTWCVSSHSVHVTTGVLRALEYAISTATKLSEDAGFRLMGALACFLEVLTSSYARTFRPQLLDWVSLVSATFDLVLGSVTQMTLAGLSSSQLLLFKVSNLILTGFTNFLATQSNPKASFQVIVEKLLDPALTFLGLVLRPLYSLDDEVQTLRESTGRLLDNGLFHSSYLEGFSYVCTVFKSTDDSGHHKSEELVSNHKLLFDKLKQLIADKKFASLSSIWYLFKLFVRNFKEHMTSLNEDVFGVRGSAHQKQGLEQNERVEAEVQAEETKRKNLTENQRLFLVFAEVTFPLIRELKDRLKVDLNSSQGFECVQLLTAVNSLFQAARDEQIYVPTRDTPSQEHMKFIKQFYILLVDYAKWLSENLRSTSDSQASAAAGFNEVISGIRCILEIEHRATEDFATLWAILLSATACQRDSRGLLGIVSCGCRILKVASELRNLGSVRLLFSSIKGVLEHSSSYNSLSLSREKYEPTIRALFCDRAFLETLKKAMRLLPEGQAAEVVSMLSADASESLSILTSSSCIIASGVTVLSELYTSVLETVPVTVTNALQVAAQVEEFVDSGLMSPLSELLAELQRIHLGTLKIKRAKAGLMLLKTFFLLRLFLQYRSLHRYCVSLMAPQKAEKAKARAKEISLDRLELDLRHAAEPLECGFFSWIGSCKVTVLEVFDSVKLVEKPLVEKEGAISPSLHYVMDLLVIHRLSDLQRYIHSVEYYEAKAVNCSAEDPLLLLETGEETATSNNKARLLLKFQDEAKTLAATLLDGSGTSSILHMETSCSEGWNEVVATLTEDSLITARWFLIARSIDFLSQHVSKKLLKSYVVRILSEWNLISVSDELLSNSTFYENKRIGRVLMPAFYKAVEKTLHLRIREASPKALFDVKGNDVFVLEDIVKAVDLFQLSGSFPSIMRSTMQHVLTVCSIERFLLAHMKPASMGSISVAYARNLLDLFAVCRRSLQPIILTDAAADTSLLSVLEWMYQSINIVSTSSVDVKTGRERLLLASVLKSTQCFVRVNMKEAFAQNSELFFMRSSNLTQADKCRDMKPLLGFFQEQIRSSASWTKDSDFTMMKACNVLGAISASSSILWAVTEVLESFDSKCQEEKENRFKWSTELPVPWLSFMREVELVIIPELLRSFAFSSSVTCTILDVFLDSSKAEPQVEKNTTEFGEKEEDDEEGKDENHEEEKNDEVEYEEGEEDEEDMNAEEGSGKSGDAEKADDDDMQSAEVQELENLNTANQVSPFAALGASEQAALRKVFSERSREYAEIVGEHFMAAGALIRLRSLYFSPYAAKSYNHKPSESPSAITLLQLLYWLLQEATDYILFKTLGFSELTWLFGAIKCMEATGFLLPSLRPALSSFEFSKLVTLHIELLGAISRRAQHGSSGSVDGEVSSDESWSRFRVAVKASFGALLKYAPRHHLLRALKTIQKFIPASNEEGDFSRNASAVDCLAVSLDAVSGPWRLKLLANYSPFFVASIMQLIGQLEGPAIFCEKQNLIVVCLEILTRLASRNVIFPMKSNHVSLALHCPSRIFRPFYNSKLSGRPTLLDGRFLVELYVTCCKLLYSTLRHRTRESGRSIAILADSVRVLLYCLEAANESQGSSWNVSMAVQCAQWLRRVYEELGEHKETLSRYCNQFISDYLAVLSGTGTFATGLSREVDRELRPGIYALLESCSPLDLQHLYANLGDGPLRNNLNLVKQDYEKKFKYTGKV